MNRCRALLADLAFKVPYKSYVSADDITAPVLGEGLAHRQRTSFAHCSSSSTSFDHNKPLIVPVGTDTLANVGAPPAVASATSGSRCVSSWAEVASL